MFVPHHMLVRAADAQPDRFMIVAHGIYGSGANWRTFARKLTERRPDWGIVAVDLRKHGRSQDAPAPHSVSAAVADLHRLNDELAVFGHRVCAIFGHSFGGKVSLAYRASASRELQQTWVIDSSPSSRPEAMDDPANTVTGVLRMLGQLPETFDSRRAFVDAVKRYGFAESVGHFLAMNLERLGSVYRSRLDVAVMRALLSDYYALDAWSAVEAGPGDVQFVVAGRSSSVSDEDRARLDRTFAVDTTIFEDSGHWVHVDAFETLLDLVASRLP